MHLFPLCVWTQSWMSVSPHSFPFTSSPSLYLSLCLSAFTSTSIPPLYLSRLSLPLLSTSPFTSGSTFIPPSPFLLFLSSLLCLSVWQSLSSCNHVDLVKAPPPSPNLHPGHTVFSEERREGERYMWAGSSVKVHLKYTPALVKYAIHWCLK